MEAVMNKVFEHGEAGRILAQALAVAHVEADIHVAIRMAGRMASPEAAQGAIALFYGLPEELHLDYARDAAQLWLDGV